VTVVKSVSPAAATPAADLESEAYDPPGIGETTSPEEPTESELPGCYADQATSGLTAVVQADEPNAIDFIREK
jgi:hypothetical protein